MYIAYDNTLHAPAGPLPKGDKRAMLESRLATFRAKEAAGAG